MPRPKSKSASTQALVGLWAMALTAFVIVALYFARSLLIPFALSALLTFLISPLVGRLERWLGRIAAVVLAVGLIFGAVGGAGWMVSRQLVDLATKLPEYKGNIVTKLHAFQPSKEGIRTEERTAGWITRTYHHAGIRQARDSGGVSSKPTGPSNARQSGRDFERKSVRTHKDDNYASDRSAGYRVPGTNFGDLYAF